MALLAALLIFQIGIPDGSYREFAIAGNYAAYPQQFPRDVTFTVGKSDAAKDWPFIQPGPVDVWAGSRTHPFRILFDLPQEPAGFYRLTINLVNTHYDAPPEMLVEINGAQVRFKTPAGGGDASLTDPAAGKPYAIKHTFPAALLKKGQNSITLTGESGSWALYDCVKLEGNVEKPEHAEIEGFRATPLPFFRRVRGGVRRVARIAADNWGSADAAGELHWKMGADEGTRKLPLRYGQNELFLPIPDATEETPAEFTLKVGDKVLTEKAVVKPARRWRIFIAPTVHTDIGYTDLQDRVAERHAANTETILDAMRKYPDFGWDSETFWQLDCFLRLRRPRVPELFERAKEGRFALSGLFGNMLTGLCSHEALNRVCLDARRLGKAHGFPVTGAILDDVPSAVASLPTVLAQSGIRYFVEGCNTTRGPYATAGLKNPFWWEGPDGSRVLCNIAPGYAAAGGLIGSPAQAAERIPRLVEGYERPDFPYDALYINGLFSDNCPATPGFAEAVEAWNKEWEFPKLILAGPEAYLKYMEDKYGDKLPVLKGDFGGWWEDGAGSSALETALCRRAEERGVTAEMLHALVGPPEAYPRAECDQIWRNALLYDEHTWGAAGSISDPKGEQTVKQWEVKSSFARQAAEASRKVLASGLSALETRVPVDQVAVFNPLSWARSGVVYTANQEALVDAETKAEAPGQPLPEGGWCFTASKVPGVGVRLYRPQTSPAAAERVVTVTDDGMESRFYKLALDPKTGAIRSLVDKESGKELVDAAGGYGIGDVVYVAGGEGTRAVDSNFSLPDPKFTTYRQERVSVEKTAGPVFGELAVTSRCEKMPQIVTRIRLYRDLKQVDIRCEIEKTETTAKEAVYVAFPFDLEPAGGGLWLEYPDAITEPLKDALPGACKDWYAVQRWVGASDGKASVVLSPLDTPLVSLGDMNAGKWLKELSVKKAHVFACAMNNYWFTNYKASQGGRMVFRFSLTSWAGPFSKEKAVQRGWEMFSPMVACQGRGQRPVPPMATGSLLPIEPALPLLAAKQSDDGKGLLFRVWDPTGKGGPVKLGLPAPGYHAFTCSLTEEDEKEIPVDGRTVSVPLKPYGVATVKVVRP